MSIIKYKGQRWHDEGFALWGVSYKGNMYEGLIRAVKAFEDIFVPEKFSYNPFGFGYYTGTSWFDIRKIEDIKNHVDPEAKNCYVFGRIKIIKSNGSEAWIDGVSFGSHDVTTYSNISVNILTDDWLLLQTDLRSHKIFNNYFDKMKETLQGEVTDYGGYEGIGKKHGFDIERVREVRKEYTESIRKWEEMQKQESERGSNGK